MPFTCIVKGANVRIIKGRQGCALCLAFLSVFVLGAFFSGNAGAVETTRASGFIMTLEDATSLQPSPSRDTADPCLPLLQTVRHATVSAVYPNRRPAGTKAATVGFVLGLRNALGPTETNGLPRDSGLRDPFAKAGLGGSYALSVAAYRACKSDIALKSLRPQTR